MDPNNSSQTVPYSSGRFIFVRMFAGRTDEASGLATQGSMVKQTRCVKHAGGDVTHGVSCAKAEGRARSGGHGG